MTTLVTSVEEVPENGSYLFTVRDADGGKEEVILVDTPEGIAAWKNFCLHETDQRLDTGRGATFRSGTIVCPRHGSAFDAESGACDNGPAAGSALVDVDVAVRHGQVYLTDDGLEFLHDGGIDDGDGSPDSTSHLRF